MYIEYNKASEPHKPYQEPICTALDGHTSKPVYQYGAPMGKSIERVQKRAAIDGLNCQAINLNGWKHMMSVGRSLDGYPSDSNKLYH